ncbi:MAG: endonuclease [Duncaniella sp.]|nr:endonuclease [Duncaniella sp.]
MTLYRFFSLFLAAAAFSVSAEVPTAYYSRLDGKSGEELKTTAFQIINPHSTISSYSDLPQYFMRTDLYPETMQWWDMYSDIPLYAPSFKGLNREHAFPKSWWGGSTDTPAYIDLNHLYPSEARANQAKSNYPLGVVQTAKFDNGITTVGYAVSGQGGGAAQVFEPDDEYKGDFARTYFYMVTCYQNLTWKYTYMVQNNTYPTLNAWALDLLLKWHREDPVSQKEIERNETIYGIQNNRNPFIDFPDLAEYIWGDKVGEPFKVTGSSEPVGDPVMITPTNGMSLDFPDVAVGGESTAKLFFHTQNFTKDISVTVSGTNRSFFTPDDRSISCKVTNTDNGYWLNIKYKPTTTGEHEGRLVVYDGNITGSFWVDLRGKCYDVPVLTAPTALPASDITETSYLASWEVPEDEVVDYFVVTRTRYVSGAATVEELLAEENVLEIENFDKSDRESYAVQSVRLGYRSPMSNIVNVDRSGINDISADMPLAVESYPGVVRFVCSGDHTGARLYDISGHLVMTLPVITPGMEISLPAGAYILVTDSHPAPVKLIAY